MKKIEISARRRFRHASSLLVLVASAAMLAACASPEPRAGVTKKSRSKEYFAESEYGVKASPLVAMRRGGGRDQLGKPYQVRGKWYYPKEEKRYSKVGSASWYGDAFHSRLTANGEVYDVSRLTAAHPTMPLPSYARVTNLDTGGSVIVRVNDRGPYHEGRIIDLSKRAAEMLGYASVGTARVKVDYVGRAPLDGNDDQFLMASYQPGNKPLDPSVGLPTGVMIAMNGSTPGGKAAAAFPGQLVDVNSSPAMPVQTASFDGVSLPDFGPIVPERPDIGLPPDSPFAVASMSYAEQRVTNAAVAFAALDKSSGMTSADILRSWKERAPAAATAPAEGYVAAGSYEDAGEARRISKDLAAYGDARIERSAQDGRTWYTVNLYPDGRASLDGMLEAAWAHGAPDALAVRD